MPKRLSTKKIAIDKAYATIVIAVAVAAFITVFSLVASKALLDQRAYQSKVLGAKQDALETLEENIIAADELATSYLEFTEAPENILGGNPTGDADRDGDNARIVLDSLPSVYDFPALTTSIDKLLRDSGFPPSGITGTDNEALYSSGGGGSGEIATAEEESSGSVFSSSGSESSTGEADSEVVEMPFSVEVVAGSQEGKKLMRLFERSIRPIDIQSITIKGGNENLEFSINAVTYFKPAKKVNVSTEVVQP